MPLDAAQVISDKLNIPRKQVAAVLRLFADGATIPFIARYRKEATGSLDEVALNSIRTNAKGIYSRNSVDAGCAHRGARLKARLLA